MDTIFALASGRGKSGIAVMRISGPEAARVFQAFSCNAPKPRQAEVRILSMDGEILDEAIVVHFTEPNSFTGEDVVELHLHGSVATVNAVLSSLGRIPGFRLAEAGEFTRRALENEKLDLAQVEGLSDLIEAETEAQRRQALRVLSGGLGRIAETWRSDIVRASALLEATIDFADEEVPVNVLPEVKELLERTVLSLNAEVRGVGVAERIRDGFEVAIVGRPNVGKSTLLNALAGREAAITSEIAGTTRDVIEVRMDLGGLPVTFLDTAGLRDVADVIESIGIERAKARAEQADLRVILLERKHDDAPLSPRGDDIVVVSKSDITVGDFSAITGDGVDRLVGRISSILEERAGMAGVAIRERHRIAMERANSALGIALDRLEASPDLAEMIAEDVRDAVRALDSLVGRVDVEHILDEIFANFCIGK
ncbi:tRNA uridine-5-carboxymethylaminomethyl(34) synthesis GTPase MnmE [Silicimonas sp. MF1-12-2]|uniref:tRNA uridine-5-carboxymethylaminomethyl(34) synthesis GTPase MnmE n=1 Tax=Silicimonas sp. MF1-12-2 TaxID=3384793 RepID=UPI0039B4A307